MKIKKLGLGALASGSIAAAAFALVASPAAADVAGSPTLSDDSIQIGQSVTLNTVLTNTTEDIDVGDQVSLSIDSFLGGGEATFNISDSDALSCLLDEVDLGDDDAVGGAGADEDSATLNCQGEDVDVENLTAIDADSISDGDFDVSLTGTESGQIVVYAQHEETAIQSVNALVLGTSASGDVDALEVSAPTSANAGDEVTVTITAVDDEGDAVPGEVITAEVNSGDVDGIADGDTDTTDSDGEASFTFTIEDDEDTGVSLTFFTGTGSITDDVDVDVTIVIAGDADSVEVTAEESVETGSTSSVSATVLDADGNPVPDAAIDFIVSGGNIVACDEETDGDGVAECTLVAPSAAGTVQITAVAAGAAGTATVTVTQGTGEGGDGTLTTPNFGSGNVGSAVFAGGSIEQLASAVQAAGGTGVWVQGTDGNWYRYTVGATGSTAFVNNAFNAQFAGGFSGATAVIVVK